MSLTQTEDNKKTDCAQSSPFESFANMGQQWLAWPCIADRHSGKSFDEEASQSPSRFARFRPIYPATRIFEQNIVNATSFTRVDNRFEPYATSTFRDPHSS